MTNEETFTCQFCGKTCKNKMSKVKHEHMCKQNPDYEKHLEVLRNTTLKARCSDANREMDRKRVVERHAKFLEQNPDEAYKDFDLTCRKCGCTFTRRLKIRHFKMNYRIPQFCCQAHANSHTISEESRRKTAISISKERMHKCPKCGKEFMHRGSSIHSTFCEECHLKNHGYERTSRGNKRSHKSIPLHESRCPSCGKSIWVKTDHEAFCYDCCDKLNKYHYQLYTKDGKRLVSEKTRQKWREAQQLLVKNGTHVGWKSRNITSYPERFWIKVLNNNGIDFIREKRVNGYFLDFVLRKGNKEIDLEIDGKQHKYEDRKAHDKKRDKNLRETGYIIYRIDWNEINSKRGSLKMKAKIRQFLWWLEHQ